MATRQQAARDFVKTWQAKPGREDSERQTFLNDLLERVFGIDDYYNYIEYEKPVRVNADGKITGRDIDGYIPSTKVLFEMKGKNDKDLSKPIRQSGGDMLTPFQQAQRYMMNMKADEKPRWIIISNFNEFDIYNLNTPHEKPTIIKLEELPTKFKALEFIVDAHQQQIINEKKLSVAAGSLVSKIYRELRNAYAQHGNPDDPKIQKSLNMLIVRIVFLLYADDTAILGGEDIFQQFLENRQPRHIREGLQKLFKILDTKPEDRDPYDDEEYLQFKYVNGGMFSDEDVIIPQFTEELKDLIVNEAGKGFNWSNISPTIFGATFESTLNPDTRRKGGMHYTSVENIHKVIDPLFLNDLRDEFSKIVNMGNSNQRIQRAEDFQNKIAKLKFLDPACGSGNFLTETYLSLRKMENECLKIIYGSKPVLATGEVVKVKIQNFYGIEINDFAVAVARTAMWIAENQTLEQTKDTVYYNKDFLPLDSNDSIYEGNALRMDWSDIIKPYELNYIMGNPPFVGYKYLSDNQKKDLTDLMGKIRSIDYVVGWYYKALDFIEGSSIKAAFVSTNSITQGSAIQNVWEPLYKRHKKLNIIFGYRTFTWQNETKNSAAVHCVIIGFSLTKIQNKAIYDGDESIQCREINPYLVPGPFIPINRIGNPRQKVGKMTKGAQLIDGGNFMVTSSEKSEILKQSPKMTNYVYEYLNSHMFLHNHVNDQPQYVLYLKDCDPSVIRKSRIVMKKIKAVKEYRENSHAKTTRELADRPAEYFQSQVPKHSNIIVPVVSSGNREYIPMDFMPPKHVYTNALFYIDNANLVQFGILQSSVHMKWANQIVGRLKSDFRYSNSIVYNNFPWPKLDDETKQRITKSAQGILDARSLYPDDSLADLYDPLSMPSKLRKAHRINDRVVLKAYDIPEDANERQIVSKLFKMYSALVQK